ncbi:polyhydroxyalkanoate biosynthesis repressor PhaR [Bacillus sp. AFS076308]|uniref:polyhydroxyalkanoate biosynthesis repressor PhaR n=1 Tax=unclassified Bacillus (in: firmicutes) TaxID=185979 RepID=UPI000BFA3187|nr:MULTISPECIES: polyhydroxyalkanoate biosynthesis repressor PhaR [unclassified Bacillus (in: firmicutes)]PFO06383.1 polyhydroxyalkanoate biosynthesis repressor PhaR [Bacillus sp. AFS076308]PGV49413.1 polyhydroxyalkanoate biosynthesis repressor PhaR [Bacillus sp. AFS037270]
MSDKENYDPYESLHKFSLLWEKQINDFIFLLANNKDYVKMSHRGTDLHSRILETFKKNQEALAGALNFPTKNDVTNVANLTLQAEEKMEALEEQIWDLQDSVKSQNKEIESVVEVSKEIIKLTKQLKNELVKTKKELSDTKSLHAELQELKFELLKLNNFKQEFETIKDLIKEEKSAEPVLTGTASGN